MSYLNVPRLHFAGKFQADPSTVNNNDANFDPTVKLGNATRPDTDDPTNTSVYWNFNGTHNWVMDCTVRGAAGDQGPFSAPSQDPIIGASLLSAGKYPAKLVDLDPDSQGVSQIWGLQIQVSLPDPASPGKALASVTGTLPATAFGDLWNRCTNAPRPGMPTMSASFQGVLENVVWVNAAASPLLAALKAKSPSALSIRFTVDSYQPDSNQQNFTFGRVVGTIGPSLPGEAPRSAPRRLAPAVFMQPPPPLPLIIPVPPAGPSIFSTFGAAGAVWDGARGVLILDLGNCVPTDGTPTTSGPSVPEAGWPIPDTTLKVTLPGPTVTPPAQSFIGLKSGSEMTVDAAAPTVLGTLPFTLSTYTTFAGIVEIPVAPALVGLLQSQPLTITDITIPTAPAAAVQEDAQGRYVDVDTPFLRLNPGDAGKVTLRATRFGAPWAGAALDVALLPPSWAANGPPQPSSPPPPPAPPPAPPLWLNSSPPEALALSGDTVTTGPDGTAVLTLNATDPGTPRTYPDGQLGPDGQVYWITGSWASWGQIFLFPGAPINVLLFSAHAMPADPNWQEHVLPIFSNYARMYPYMKSIIDLADYPSVKANATAIRIVLNLPPAHPHHMPVVRDLSRDKLAMINQWINLGMPQGPATKAAT